MNRRLMQGLLVVAVVAMAFSVAAPQADAQWWGWYRPVAWSCGYSCYSPCYSTCCYSSCYSPYYDGGWYLGWRPGPLRRLLFGRYRWYWGGGYWGTCCPTYDVCCTDGAVAAPADAQQQQQPTPAKKPVVEPAMPAEPAAPMPAEPAVPDSSSTSAERSGTLTVWVPFDAKVTVNGLETRSTGSRRQFVSYGLKPGFSYKYVVRAEVVRDGQVQVDTRTVTLTAGQITAVAFGFNAPAEQVAAR